MAAKKGSLSASRTRVGTSHSPAQMAQGIYDMYHHYDQGRFDSFYDSKTHTYGLPQSHTPEEEEQWHPVSGERRLPK